MIKQQTLCANKGGARMEKRMQVILLWAAFTIFAAGGVLFLL